jgi:hypothetical protein
MLHCLSAIIQIPQLDAATSTDVKYFEAPLKRRKLYIDGWPPNVRQFLRPSALNKHERSILLETLRANRIAYRSLGQSSLSSASV